MVGLGISLYLSLVDIWLTFGAGNIRNIRKNYQFNETMQDVSNGFSSN